jgi:hypothetical protein
MRAQTFHASRNSLLSSTCLLSTRVFLDSRCGVYLMRLAWNVCACIRFKQITSCKAACTRCKLARTSSLAGINVQTFHASSRSASRENARKVRQVELWSDFHEMPTRASPRVDSCESTRTVYTLNAPTIAEKKSRGKFDRLEFEVSCDFYETSPCASPRVDSRDPTCIVHT